MTTFKETFQLFLQRTFDIRNGELFRASLMQLNIFLIISTLLIIKPTVNSLFLSRFGVENLPYAFLLVAVVAAIVTSLYAYILQHFPLQKIISGTLVFSVFSLLFFGLFLRLNVLESLLLFSFYIWVAIFALLTTSQFWVLANRVFNPREAKRLFGFIGAGAIAGGIFGGYLTSILAQFTSSENLPFVGAIFIGSCLPINKIIWTKYVGATETVTPTKKRVEGFGNHPLVLIRKSRHLTYLASIVFVSVMVAKLVDYQFGGIASALIPDQDELTAFFGFWLSTFSVISLGLQLFVTRKVVSTFGVGSALLFLPVAIFIAVIFLILFPGILAAAVLLKMSDGGLKQSINKAAIELLILPVPEDYKNQTKTFIDVFVDSLATGISGILLLFLAQASNLSMNAVNLMIIGLLSFWFYLIFRVKKEYLLSFRRKIDQPQNNGNINHIDLTNPFTLKGIKKTLELGSPQQKLAILQRIKGKTPPILFDSVKNLVAHSSDKLKEAAIRYLYFYQKGTLLSAIESHTLGTNQTLKVAAFEYLIKHGNKNREKIIEKYLQTEDYQVNGAALISLAQETRENLDLKRQFKLADRIREKLNKLPGVTNPEEKEFRTITTLKAIGQANMETFFPFIQNSFYDKNETIANCAIIEAGATLNLEFINPLVQLLAKPPLRQSVRKALTNYGKSLIPKLSEMVFEEKIDLEVTRMIPSVIKQIGAQKSVNFLFELLENEDLMVQQEALRGLNFLKNNFSKLKFNLKKINAQVQIEIQLYRIIMSALYAQIKVLGSFSKIHSKEETEARNGLIHLLKKRLDRSLERIFRLLGLEHSNGDIYAIYKGVRSQQADLSVNALEFMDNLLNPNLRKDLIPLVEASMQGLFSEQIIQALQLQISTEKESFQLLLAGKDRRIKLSVLYLLGFLKEEEQFQDMLVEQMQSADLKVRRFAQRMQKEVII